MTQINRYITNQRNHIAALRQQPLTGLPIKRVKRQAGKMQHGVLYGRMVNQFIFSLSVTPNKK